MPRKRYAPRAGAGVRRGTTGRVSILGNVAGVSISPDKPPALRRDQRSDRRHSSSLSGSTPSGPQSTTVPPIPCGRIRFSTSRAQVRRFNTIRASMGLPPDQPALVDVLRGDRLGGRLGGRGGMGVLPQPAPRGRASPLRVEQPGLRWHSGLRGVSEAPDRMFYGGMPRAKAEKSLRLFAEKVLPAVQAMPTPINPASLG
jgi:hypothetical protein